LFFDAGNFGFGDAGHGFGGLKNASSSDSSFYSNRSYTLSLLPASQLCGIIVTMHDMGRPAKNEQPEYGMHLAALRNAASLSQQQLANIIGVRQATVAAWERSPTPPRGEFLLPLSDALKVSIEELLKADAKRTAKHRGPASKLELLLSDITRLPKRRQQRITSLLEALITEEAKAS
jgi:transcriptional regulator with XRE-family HTH domain